MMRLRLKTAVRRSLILAIFSAALMTSALSGLQSVLAQSNGDLVVREFDEIWTKSGKHWVGELLEDNGIKVEFKTSAGTSFGIDKSDVERILRKNPPEAIYAIRNRSLRAEGINATDSLKLAKWCLKWALRPEAMVHFEQVTTLDPNNPEPYAALMDLYADVSDEGKNLERRDKEVGVCLRGMEAGIELPALPARAAKHLELLGDYEGAASLLQTLLAMGNVEPELQRNSENDLARLLILSGQSAKAKALVERLGQESEQREQELSLMKIRWLLEDQAAGDASAYERLEQEAKKMLKADASHPNALLLIACARMLAGNDQAQRSFTKALSGGPSIPLTLSFALYHATQGNQLLAEKLLRSIRNVVGNKAKNRENYHLILAYMLENEQQHESAWLELEAVVSEPGASWQAWIIYLQTMLRLNKGSLNPKLDEFLAVYGQNPPAFAEAALLRGEAALLARDGLLARRWLAYALQVNGEDPESLLRFGSAQLLEGGDLSIARASLEKAYRLDAKNLALRNVLGCLEYRSGNFDLARRWFNGVINEYSDKQRTLPAPPAPLAYAKRAIRQIQGVVDQELWQDRFDRNDSDSVLNNWLLDNKFGIGIRQENGVAQFSGQQQFEDDGLTLLTRQVKAENLARIRCKVKLQRGAAETRIAIRLESLDGSKGLVFFRALDGVMAFATISRDKVEEFMPLELEAEVSSSNVNDLGENSEAETDEEKAKRDRLQEFNFVRVRWPDDGKEHSIEIELGENKTQATLYLDGVRIASNVPIPSGSRGGFQIGVSAQAKLGTAYQFTIDDFQVFRWIQKETKSNRR